MLSFVAFVLSYRPLTYHLFLPFSYFCFVWFGWLVVWFVWIVCFVSSSPLPLHILNWSANLNISIDSNILNSSSHRSGTGGIRQIAGPGLYIDALSPLVTTTNLPSSSPTSSTPLSFGKGGLGQDNIHNNSNNNNNYHHMDVDNNSNNNNTPLSVPTTHVDEAISSSLTPTNHHIEQQNIIHSTDVGRNNTPPHSINPQLDVVDIHNHEEDCAVSQHGHNSSPKNPRERSLASGSGGGKSPSSRRLQSDDNHHVHSGAASAHGYGAKEGEDMQYGSTPTTPRRTSTRSDHTHYPQQQSNQTSDRKSGSDKDHLDVGDASTRSSPGYSPGDSGKKRTLAKKLLDSFMVKSPFKFSR